jgi:hypothetical protein
MAKRKRYSQTTPIAEAKHEGVNGIASSMARLPDATRERLAELSRLEPDWDSYGALPITPEALAAAGSIIGNVIARTGEQGLPRDIMPIADGGVALEWRRPGFELGLNACPEGGWTSLLVERGEGGRRASERYDLTDADAFVLIFRVIGADPA